MKSPIVLLVKIVLGVLVGLGAFLVLAPYAPDGSWIATVSENMRDVMAAWWGQPVR